jgi:hypothetical protein
VTVFDQSKPSEFIVEGEAPTASMALQYMENLKKNPALQAFHFTTSSPEILPNDHAQFRIIASL